MAIYVDPAPDHGVACLRFEGETSLDEVKSVLGELWSDPSYGGRVLWDIRKADIAGANTGLFRAYANWLSSVGQLSDSDRNAVLVPPGDPEALAHAMATVVRDPARRVRLGAQAREDAVSRHSWTRHVDQILEAIDALAPAQRHARR